MGRVMGRFLWEGEIGGGQGEVLGGGRGFGEIGGVEVGEVLPYVPKTTRGKVLPRIHSPMAPRIINRPPKKKNDPNCFVWIRLVVLIPARASCWGFSVTHTDRSGTSASSASPAHEVTCKRRQTHDEPDESSSDSQLP